MDIKTLVIVGIVMALAGTLSMATIFLTRRVYLGFGYWTLGTLCRMLGSLLFLPRDQLSPWLTIILANILLFVDIILIGHGLRIFRNRKVSAGIEIIALLSFIVLFIWFTSVVPDTKMRILAVVYLCLRIHGMGGIYFAHAATGMVWIRRSISGAGAEFLVFNNLDPHWLYRIL